MKNILMLALVLAFTFGLCGCSGTAKSGTDPSSDANVTSAISPVTSEPASTPTPEPTQKPKPTPIPTPASVYIPRDPLPGGRLIEEGLFAVIPGEGAYYNVFDSYGKQVDSFLFKDAESLPPIGIFTEQELAKFRRTNQKDVQTLVPEDPEQYNNLLQSSANGFYQISRDYEENNSKVILYNTSGEPVRTLSCPDSDDGSCDIALICIGDETVISFQSYVWQEKTNTPIYSITIYFITPDGTINNKCEAADLPGKPAELLGRKYFITSKASGDERYYMYDFDGNEIMNGVLLLGDMYENPNRLVTTEASTHIYISDYYSKDSLMYDSSFKPVEKNEVGTDGKLIYGNEYDVQGITCIADQYQQGFAFNRNYDYSQLIAVGTSGDKMAIKTQDKEYLIDRNGAAFYCMNSHLVVLGPADGHKNQVVSLDTGEVLCSIDDASGINIADEYIVIYTGGYDPNNGTSSGAYIIDNSGNIRYMTEGSAIGVTHSEYIVLRRGPYIGIADLNGEWIVKSLSWNLSRDEVYIDPWA